MRRSVPLQRRQRRRAVAGGRPDHQHRLEGGRGQGMVERRGRRKNRRLSGQLREGHRRKRNCHRGGNNTLEV